MSSIRYSVVAFATFLVAQTCAQIPVESSLALDYSAAKDLLGDAVWTNSVVGAPNLAFAATPERQTIDSSDYRAIVAGYQDGAVGLDGYFDQGTPNRGRSDGSFELWVNVTALSGGSDQVLFEAGGSARGIAFMLSNNQVRFTVVGNTPTPSSITQTLATGVHHLVGIIRCQNDGLANDSIELFLNGTRVQRINNLLIDDWAGANPSGLGKAASSVAGATAPRDFSGHVAALRYFANRALTESEVNAANNVFRDRIATTVVGRRTTTNYATTSASADGFTPTKVRQVNGTFWGLDFVESDGTDGLVNGQFKQLNVYSSTDGKNWTFVRVGLDHFALPNTQLASRQFTQTPDGNWAFYCKRHGATTTLKEMACLFSETIDGPYSVAFVERPYGFSSGDLGVAMFDGELYIISAATDEGEINIFRTNKRGDDLVQHTANLAWTQPGTTTEDHREAPALFRRNGYFILTTSGKTGWKPNQQKYAYATALAGPWSALVPFGDATGYHSQLFFVSGTNGTQEAQKLFSATRNSPQWGGEGGSRPVTLPMYFNTDIKMAVNYYDEVVVNETTGTVEGFHYDHGRKLDVSRAFLPNASDDLSALIDGNESTSWSNANASTKKEIRWDLGSPKLVKALKLMPTNWATQTYIVEIYVGDGTNWTQVFPTADAPPIVPMMSWPAPLDVADATGRYVRMNLIQTWNNANSASGYANTIGFHETEIWGETSSAGAELSENFNSQTTGSAPAGWTISAGTSTSAKITAIPSTTNKSVQLVDTSATASVLATRSFTKQRGSQVVVEAYYRTDQAGTGEYLRLLDGSTVALDLVNSATAGGLAQTDNAWNHFLLAPLSVGTWHYLRIEINTDLDSFDLYLDGRLAWGGGQLRNKVSGINKLMLGTNNQSTGVSAYFDNLTIDGPMPAAQ